VQETPEARAPESRTADLSAMWFCERLTDSSDALSIACEEMAGQSLSLVLSVSVSFNLPPSLCLYLYLCLSISVSLCFSIFRSAPLSLSISLYNV